MSEKYFHITRCLGTDNTSDPTQLKIRQNGGMFFRELLNVDIDDEGMIHRCQSFDETPIVEGNNIHSIWSSGEMLLFVEDGSFKKMDMDGNVTTLISGIDPNDRMVYVNVNDIVYFSNHSIVGYVYNGASYPFPEPNQTFKARMVGGHILEYYNSRLYAANGGNLFFSDATILTRMDKRKNTIPFPGRLTMVKAVGDGLYVSAGHKTYFLKGGDPSEFSIIQVLDEEAIQGSAVTVDGDDIGRGISGRTIYFLTHSGPYKGYPGGMVVEMQGGFFNLPDNEIEIATSMVRNDNGYRQYMVIYQLRAGIGGASGEIRLPCPSIYS